MLVKVAARKNGRCRRGSRHVKNKKGCWRQSRAGMHGSKRRR